MAPSYDISTRAQVITLKALGFSNQEICSKLGLLIAHFTINRIYKKALSRGFNPEKPICLDHYIKNAP